MNGLGQFIAELREAARLDAERNRSRLVPRHGFELAAMRRRVEELEAEHAESLRAEPGLFDGGSGDEVRG